MGSFPKISAEDAYTTTLASSASKWPTRAKPDRLEPICLPAIQSHFSLTPGNSVFTIGSCFARHIEDALKRRGFLVPALDFDVPAEELWPGTKLKSGILNKYTPHSMLNEIEFAIGDTDGSEYLIETGDDLVWDAQLHTTVSVTRERALERRRQLRSLYLSALRDSPLVIVTLGLVECWWDSVTSRYLNETIPKALTLRFPGRFQFEVLSPEASIASVCRLIQLMHDVNPTQRAMITVSPIPLQRSFSGEDVIVANTYSKAVLRVAAEEARRRFKHTDYYPSFESVTHTDRNIAWEDDLVHVRPNLVAYNVDRMIADYLSPE